MSDVRLPATGPPVPWSGRRADAAGRRSGCWPTAGHGPPGHALERHGPLTPPAGAAHGVAPAFAYRRTPLQYLLGTQGFYGAGDPDRRARSHPPAGNRKRCANGDRAPGALGPLPPPPRWTCARAADHRPGARHECPFAQVSASDASAEALVAGPRKRAAAGAFGGFFRGGVCLTPSGSGGLT